MEEELDPTPDDTVSNSNGDILEVNVENLRQSSLANLAARMQLENSIDSDGLARVLVLYTGGTIGMVHKSGGKRVPKLCPFVSQSVSPSVRPPPPLPVCLSLCVCLPSFCLKIKCVLLRIL